MTKHNLSILFSGSGSTMEAILQAIKKKKLSMNMACVIASREDAEGIEKAKKYLSSDKIFVVNPKDFRTSENKIDREKFGRKLLKILKQQKTTVITQNGWLPKTPQNVIKAYNGMIFNQHPGPLPETAGQYGRMPLATIQYLRQKQNRHWWTEVVAQRVDADFDKGAIVKLAKVPIYKRDTIETLQKRVIVVEHHLQIDLLKDVATDTVTEIQNTTPIIRPGEEKLLEKAKEQARATYPKG